MKGNMDRFPEIVANVRSPDLMESSAIPISFFLRLSMRFGLVAKNDRLRPLAAAWKICLYLAKTVCYEILVYPAAGKMVVRKPTNLESI